MNSKRKGGVFEREICTRLSLWWSGDESDDLFWRTSNSGGRATVRSNKGRRTHGQYGDIGATRSFGEPLIQALTIELKRGYNRSTMFDLFDKPRGAARQEMEVFLEQIISNHRKADSVSWLLIVRRDRRRAVVFFPRELFRILFAKPPIPWAGFTIKIEGETQDLVAMRFETFLDRVQPFQIKQLLEKTDA